ncbi:MAG: hypothetical protein AAFU79_11630 [Myxococcota bacterium]
MMNGISGAQSTFNLSGLGRGARPDPNQIAEKAIGKLDVEGKGFVDRADLEAKVAGRVDPAKLDEVFSRIDGDGDGRLTEAELAAHVEEKQQQLAGRLSQIAQSQLGRSGLPHAGQSSSSLASMLMAQVRLPEAEDRRPSFFV